jgi:endoglucanase
MTHRAHRSGPHRPRGWSARRLAALAGATAILLAGAAHAAGAPVAEIKINQLGFLPAAQKLAVVPGDTQASFSVVDAATGAPVLDGKLAAAAVWDASGERVRVADFSALRAPGRYRVRVAGLPDSVPFSVAADVYRALNVAAIRSYTLNRSGIAPAGRSGRTVRAAASPSRYHGAGPSLGRFPEAARREHGLQPERLV